LQIYCDEPYGCEFTALEGLVYPDFEQALTIEWPNPRGKAVGGIDFGWRNPFAAVWGVLDRDDVLWIGSERYGREIPLHEHAAALPRTVLWFADPAGRTEIEEMRLAGLAVRSGFNDVRLGIAAVTARLRTGRLKIHAAACPNLVQEARLYRYPSPRERGQHGELGEHPIDDHNHALGALRYLIACLDARFIARLRGTSAKQQAASAKPQASHNSWNNPDLWTPLS